MVLNSGEYDTAAHFRWDKWHKALNTIKCLAIKFHVYLGINIGKRAGLLYLKKSKTSYWRSMGRPIYEIHWIGLYKKLWTCADASKSREDMSKLPPHSSTTLFHHTLPPHSSTTLFHHTLPFLSVESVWFRIDAIRCGSSYTLYHDILLLTSSITFSCVNICTEIKLKVSAVRLGQMLWSVKSRAL